MPIVEGGRTTHTTLECKRVADSLRFYRDVMGLQVNQIAPGVGHVFDSKDQYAAVLQNASPGPQPFWREYVCAENNTHVVIGNETYFLSAEGFLMPAKRNQAPPDLRYFNQTRK